jgi:hypothetical protein
MWCASGAARHPPDPVDQTRIRTLRLTGLVGTAALAVRLLVGRLGGVLAIPLVLAGR